MSKRRSTAARKRHPVAGVRVLRLLREQAGGRQVMRRGGAAREQPMRQRHGALIVAAAALAVLAAGGSGTLPAAAQQLPRTADGHPDLQGLLETAARSTPPTAWRTAAATPSTPGCRAAARNGWGCRNRSSSTRPTGASRTSRGPPRGARSCCTTWRRRPSSGTSTRKTAALLVGVPRSNYRGGPGDSPDRRLRGAAVRMGACLPRRSHGRPPARRRRHQAVQRRFAAAAGKATRWSST